jgi:hypothetical protein
MSRFLKERAVAYLVNTNRERVGPSEERFNIIIRQNLQTAGSS